MARQKAIQNFYFVGFISALSLLVTLLYALRTKRRANSVLAKQKFEIEESNRALTEHQKEILFQNQEIEKQRYNIELKNWHLEDAYRVIEGYVGKITDSIRYAERIQKAILPPLALTSSYFADYFNFFKPKDFVSGDFYWLTVKDDRLFMALADCTGHGVPGAFMSIIGMDLLSQAVNQQNLTDPSKILDYLNVELRNKLRKEDEEELILKDSMDVAVFTLSSETKTLTYSGAQIPLVILRKNEVIELKPQPSSIGISPKLLKNPFENKTIELESGDWLYLYSDGFMDQFGGNENKKFMRSRFFSTLQSISSMNGASQEYKLKSIFYEWKGNNEQIDDVLIIGLKA